MKKSGKNVFSNFAGSVNSAAKGEITSKTARILCVYFVLISVLELLAYSKGGFFSVLASRIWLFTGVLCFAAFLWQCVEYVIQDIRAKRYFMLLGIFLPLLVFGSFIGNVTYSDVNPDAAQQVAAGLSAFHQADWNYTGIAFLGYANRQYLINAIPALLFGRSIFTLHLGFGYLFLIGMVELFFELRGWLKKNGQREELALLPVYSLFGFRFIEEYFLNFEQAITPVALTMLGLALFLRFCRKPDVIGAVALAWTGCFFCDSYTPIIATLGLLVVFLGFYGLKLFSVTDRKTMFDRTSKPHALLFTLGAMELNICLFFLATLIAKRSDRITETREDISLIPFVKECILEFFTDKNAVFLGVFAGIVIVYMVLSLLGRLKLYDFFIACWVLGVIVSANYMVGYTSYSKAWIMQRTMIVIPVLITMMFLTGIRLGLQYKFNIKAPVLASLLGILLLLGFYGFSQPHQSFTYFSYIKPMKYMFSLTDEICDAEGIKPTDEFNLVLYTTNAFQTNIHDYCLFLYPNAHTYIGEAGTVPDDMDLNLPIIVFGEDEGISPLYPGDCIQKVYHDKRYDCDLFWYVKVVK